MSDIWPDNKTKAQFMQEITTCWQMVEQQKAEIERLRVDVNYGNVQNALLRGEVETLREALGE